jgi:hypothetical protein
MPASKKTQSSKPTAKAETAKPAKAETGQPEPVKEAAPKAPAKGKPQIPGKPEPSWAKFNQGGGHAQKMMKGRSFRHQGR